MRALFNTAHEKGISMTRPLHLVVLLLGLCIVTLSAQQPANSTAINSDTDYRTLGYLRFVNATGHGGKLRVFLDGQDINPSGYDDGFATGAVGFVPKTCQIEMQHDTLGDFKLSVTLKAGEVASVVALPVIRGGKEEKPGSPKGSAKAPKIELGGQSFLNRGYVRGDAISVTVLQATIAENLEVKIGGVPLICPQLEPTALSLGKGVGEVVTLSVGDKPLVTLNFVDPSDRIVILFPNKDGVLKTITLNNEVF
jgi:hypothetical protein